MYVFIPIPLCVIMLMIEFGTDFINELFNWLLWLGAVNFVFIADPDVRMFVSTLPNKVDTAVFIHTFMGLR